MCDAQADYKRVKTSSDDDNRFASECENEQDDGAWKDIFPLSNLYVIYKTNSDSSDCDLEDSTSESDSSGEEEINSYYFPKSSSAKAPPPLFKDDKSIPIDWFQLKSQQAVFARNLKTSHTNIAEDNRMSLAFGLPPAYFPSPPSRELPLKVQKKQHSKENTNKLERSVKAEFSPTCNAPETEEAPFQKEHVNPLESLNSSISSSNTSLTSFEPCTENIVSAINTRNYNSLVRMEGTVESGMQNDDKLRSNKSSDTLDSLPVRSVGAMDEEDVQHRVDEVEEEELLAAGITSSDRDCEVDSGLNGRMDLSKRCDSEKDMMRFNVTGKRITNPYMTSKDIAGAGFSRIGITSEDIIDKDIARQVKSNEDVTKPDIFTADISGAGEATQVSLNQDSIATDITGQETRDTAGSSVEQGRKSTGDHSSDTRITPQVNLDSSGVDKLAKDKSQDHLGHPQDEGDIQDRNTSQDGSKVSKSNFTSLDSSVSTLVEEPHAKVFRCNRTDSNVDNRISFSLNKNPAPGLPLDNVDPSDCEASKIEAKPDQTPTTVMNIQPREIKPAKCDIVMDAPQFLKENTEEAGLSTESESDDAMDLFPSNLEPSSPDFSLDDGPFRRMRFPLFGRQDPQSHGAQASRSRPLNRMKNATRRSKNSREGQSSTELRANSLSFHAVCSDKVQLSNNQMTAQRSHLNYQGAEVFISRPLNTGELVEVSLDDLSPTWLGSIQIGLTTHSPLVVKFPLLQERYARGTWILTNRSLIKDGKYVRKNYGHNLDDMKLGETVGVLRTQEGRVHFFLNRADMGVAFKDVPQDVYGFISLYGKACQVTLLDHSGETVEIETCPSQPRLLHLAKKPGQDRFGLEVEMRKGEFFIMDVQKDSPCDVAGLSVGDRLIEIDMRNVELFSIDDLNDAIPSSKDKLTLFVVDEEADRFYQKKMIALRSNMLDAKIVGTPSILSPQVPDPHPFGDEAAANKLSIPGAVFSSEDPWENLGEEEALKFVVLQKSDQKIKSRYTVLLIDSSASMAGEPWNILKTTVAEFLQGLDKVRQDHGLVEHVSMVMFGSQAGVTFYQTGNYSEVTKKLDETEPAGVTPLLFGIMTGLLPLIRKIFGPQDNLSLKLHGIPVPMRMILFSDGMVTPSNMIEGPDVLSQEVTSTLTDEFIGELSGEIQKMMKIYCVPIGHQVNQVLLDGLANLSGGRIIQPADVRMLSRSTYNHLVASQIARPMIDNQQTDMFDNKKVERVARIIYPDSTDTDMEEILQVVENAYQRNQRLMQASRGDSDSDSDSEGDAVNEMFDLKNEVGEVDTHTEIDGLPPIGTRVKLGPNCDEAVGLQINLGDGIITGHSLEDEGKVFVLFENGFKIPIDCADEEQSGVIVDDTLPSYTEGELIKIGSCVRRGPDWQWNSQDARGTEAGTVYDVKPNDIVQVKWKSGEKGQYRHGYDGLYDVIVCDPADPFGVQAKIREMNMKNKMADNEREQTASQADRAEKRFESSLPCQPDEGGVSEAEEKDLLEPSGAIENRMRENGAIPKRKNHQNQRKAGPEYDEVMLPSTSHSVIEKAKKNSNVSKLLAPQDSKPLSPQDNKPLSTQDSKSLAQKDTESSAPQDSKSLAQKDTESLSPQDSKSLAPQDTESLAPHDSKSLAPQDSKSLAPQETESLAPQDSKSLSPQDSKSLAPLETESLAPQETESLALQDSKSLAPQESKSLTLQDSGCQEVERAVRSPQELVGPEMVQVGGIIVNDIDFERKIMCMSLTESHDTEDVIIPEIPSVIPTEEKVPFSNEDMTTTNAGMRLTGEKGLSNIGTPSGMSKTVDDLMETAAISKSGEGGPEGSIEIADVCYSNEEGLHSTRPKLDTEMDETSPEPIQLWKNAHNAPDKRADSFRSCDEISKYPEHHSKEQALDRGNSGMDSQPQGREITQFLTSTPKDASMASSSHSLDKDIKGNPVQRGSNNVSRQLYIESTDRQAKSMIAMDDTLRESSQGHINMRSRSDIGESRLSLPVQHGVSMEECSGNGQQSLETLKRGQINSSMVSLADSTCSSWRGSLSQLSDVSTIPDLTDFENQWMWQAPSGEWNRFLDDKNYKIEKSFRRNPKSAVLLTVEGESYRLLLGTMKLRNLLTKQILNVKREAKPSATSLVRADGNQSTLVPSTTSSSSNSVFKPQGSTATTTPSSAAAGFSFGTGSSQAPTQPSSGFSFGTGGAAPAFGASQNTPSAGFTFGASSSQQSAAPAFGGSSTVPSAGLFSGTQSQSTNQVSAFGSSTPQLGSQTPAFGTGSQPQAPAFGATQGSSTPVFGNTANQPAPAFGSSTPAQSTGTFAFGASQPQAAAPFGQNNTPSKPTGAVFAFGQANNQTPVKNPTGSASTGFDLSGSLGGAGGSSANNSFGTPGASPAFNPGTLTLGTFHMGTVPTKPPRAYAKAKRRTAKR